MTQTPLMFYGSFGWQNFVSVFPSVNVTESYEQSATEDSP